VSNLRRVGQQPATSTDAFGVPVGAPQPTEHKEDLISYSAGSVEHRRWVREQAEAAATPVAQKGFWELAHDAHEQQKAKWRAEEQQRRIDRDKYDAWVRSESERKLAERKAAKDKEAENLVAESMLAAMFAQYGASDREVAHVKKLVASRTPHLNNDVSAHEIKLLSLRAEG
jgi:hypothetical protein